MHVALYGSTELPIFEGEHLREIKKKLLHLCNFNRFLFFVKLPEMKKQTGAVCGVFHGRIQGGQGVRTPLPQKSQKI